VTNVFSYHIEYLLRVVAQVCSTQTAAKFQLAMFFLNFYSNVNYDHV